MTMNSLVKRFTVICLVLAIVGVGCSKTSKPSLKPEDAPRVRDEALAMLQNGRVDEAMDKLKQVAVATPSDAKAQFLLGVTLYNKKDFPAAIDAYNKAVAQDPKFFEAYNNLGNTYRDMNRNVDAIASYKKAIDIAPDFVYSYTNLAGVYVSLNALTDAVSILESGVAANPTSLDVKLVLANTYLASGQKDKAAALITDLGKSYPTHPGVQKLSEELKK